MWDARAREEAGRALQLDPDLAEAHVALAAVHRFQEYDWDTVIRESRRALELNPSLDFPTLPRGRVLPHRPARGAESAIEAARQLNPETALNPGDPWSRTICSPAGLRRPSAFVLRAALSDSRIVESLHGWTLVLPGRASARGGDACGHGQRGRPVPGNARATLAAFRAARGATADARALAERVASERDLIHHAAYGWGRLRPASRSFDGGSMALEGIDDRLSLLSLVRTRSAARSHSQRLSLFTIHARPAAVVGRHAREVFRRRLIGRYPWCNRCALRQRTR